MTDAEIVTRLGRIYAAFGATNRLKPEDFEVKIHTRFANAVHLDFSGGRTPEQSLVNAISIINEITGIKDRARAWLKTNGKNPDEVEAFIKSEFPVALVQDLANADKHGQHGKATHSGKRPKLGEVRGAMTLKYDPATGTYATSGHYVSGPIDILKGKESNKGGSAGTEVVLTGDVVDEQTGDKIYELSKLLPDAIYRWERFLNANGLSLP